MPTTVETNKALIRRFMDEVMNQADYSRLDEFYTTLEVASHIKGDAPMLRRGFPDLAWVIEDLFGEGDKVAVRFTVSGTNNGPLMGRPPTGKVARWGGVTVITLKDGKIAEEWVFADRLDLMQQIGMIPASMPTHASQTEGAHSH